MLVVGVSAGQTWEIEQVSADRTALVQLRRHPDGRLFLYYAPENQLVRVAWKDSIWCFEDAGGTGQFDADIGREGSFAIGYLLAGDSMIGCGVRNDSGWRHESLPWRGNLSLPRFVVDTAGEPGNMFVTSDDSTQECALLLGRHLSGDWCLDTLWYHGGGVLPERFAAYRLLFDAQSRPVALCKDAYVNMSWREDLYVVAESGGGRVHNGWENTLGPGALGMDAVGAWGVLFSDTDCEGRNTLWYADGRSKEAIDSLARPWAVAIDTAGRPHIVYHNGYLTYRWRCETGWPLFIVQSGGVRSADLVLSDDCQPVIAFCDSRGVWLARGVGIVGTRENPTVVRREVCTATICRGVLMYRPPANSSQLTVELLDITGRRVMDLEPGENDIRHLAPGVYFVREEGSRGQGSEGSSVRKVVIQR